LAEQGYDKKMGATPLSRKIDELIVSLSKKILFERIKDSTVTVSVTEGEIGFSVLFLAGKGF